MRKHLSVIVFWGAAWGMVEASLGHALHMLPSNIGWIIWFPVAYYFLKKVYARTGSASAALYTSSIAAAIKFIDLITPVRIDRVINPAASILLEGLAVFLVLWLMNKNTGVFKYKVTEILVVSAGWRILYLMYLLPLPAWMVSISPLSGIIPLVKFIILESIVNAALIYIGIRGSEIWRNQNHQEPVSRMVLGNVLRKVREAHSAVIKNIAAFGLLICAVILQWAL